MLITVLEGEVLPENHSTLVDNYKKGVRELPPQIIKTYLVQSSERSNVWRIVTIWRSKEDLAKIQKQGTPKGVLIFRSANAEPALSVYTIKAESK
jgi:hypothetical protein